MKHLEELEKELDSLIKQHSKINAIWYSLINPHENFLKDLVLERKILQAYDAIEERKKNLLSVRDWVITDNYKKGFSHGKNTLREELQMWERGITSDYEWEWLSKQEDGDEG